MGCMHGLSFFLLQIVAEKSLVILSKLHADAPGSQLVPNQLDPLALGNFLVRIGRDCSWVSGSRMHDGSVLTIGRDCSWVSGSRMRDGSILAIWLSLGPARELCGSVVLQAMGPQAPSLSWPPNCA